MKRRTEDRSGPRLTSPGSEGEVHIWRLSLVDAPEAAHEYRSLLNAEELARERSFHFEADRDLFAAARGFLRHTLGRYCATSPEAIRFGYGVRRKPFVLGGSEKIEFNLSHTRREILLAVSHDAPVGIDVEAHASGSDWRKIYANVFSDAEIRELESLPLEAQADAFYRGWTQKEAFIKAIGTGMYAPLRDYTFRLNPNDRAELLDSRRQADPARFRMIEIRGVSGHSCSLAVDGTRSVRLFDSSLRLGAA